MTSTVETYWEWFGPLPDGSDQLSNSEFWISFWENFLVGSQFPSWEWMESYFMTNYGATIKPRVNKYLLSMVVNFPNYESFVAFKLAWVV